MAEITADTRLEDLVPPHDTQAEIACLGAMLLSDKAAEEVNGILEEEDFYRPAHKEIFRAIKQLLQSHKPIDFVTLRDELSSRGVLDNVGGVEYLIEIAESVPSAANAEHYAHIVQDQSTLRRLEMAGHDIVKNIRHGEMDADEKVDEAERLVFEVGRKRVGKHFATARSLASQFFHDVDRLMETGEPSLGTQTGLTDLDEMTTGLYGGDLTIIAARPSMGKTSLALRIAQNVAQQKIGNVAVFSLEMSGKQLIRRFVAMQAKVPMNVLKQANLSQDTFHRLADACEDLYESPVYIDDSSDITPLEVRGKCRRLKADGGLALVVIDYLQLMRSNRRTENRVQEVADIARSLKSLAKELDVPVIALSQLNRGVESRDNKRPMLADLRESGSIEAEADLVMFIYRDKYYKEKEGGEMPSYETDFTEAAEIIIGKHRNGPVGTVVVAFQRAYTYFNNLAHEDIRSYWQSLRNSID